MGSLELPSTKGEMKSLMKNCQCYARVIYQARRSNRQSAANIAKILLKKSKKIETMDGWYVESFPKRIASGSTIFYYCNIQQHTVFKAA